MTGQVQAVPDPHARVPCWDLNDLARRKKFCASAANGHGRCKKGNCWLAATEYKQ